RSTGSRIRRPHRARADLRSQAAPGTSGARPAARRRDVVLPGRFAHPRAVDALRDDGGVPGGRRDSRLPGRARRRSLRLAGAEDAQGGGVLCWGARGEDMSAERPAGEATAAPSGIVPRWEWRTFGESFGAAEGRLALLDPDRIHESDEIYLLSLESDASVKIR